MPAQWNAELYDAKHAFVWQRAEDLLELLQPARGEEILDLGCGTGHLTAKIADAGAQTSGIDSSPAMIAEAKTNYPGLKFEVADARSFHAERPFDAVFSNAALHWILEPELVAECVRNALKPGGRLLAEFGGRGNMAKFIESFAQALDTLGCTPEKDPNPWYFPSVGEYATLLEEHGFEVTLAMLFDRPTRLDDGEDGLRNWITMFGEAFLAGVPRQQRDAFIREVERQLRPRLFREGAWYADYRRLRIAARRR
ncbi:MAG: class I SAM-dependent methyltransferase [Terriglobia bacterium]